MKASADGARRLLSSAALLGVDGTSGGDDAFHLGDERRQREGDAAHALVGAVDRSFSTGRRLTVFPGRVALSRGDATLRRGTTMALFTPDDTALLLIDHQLGTMSWIRSADQEEVKANALALAKAAVALDMPLILTTSLEDHAQGPLLPEFAEIASKEYESRIQRVGVVNAMDDPAFATAVRAAGRPNLVIAGATNDVCTVHPTLTALQQGYRVQVVADAGGSMSKSADEIALRRMDKAGAGIASTNMLLTELAANWASPAGQKLIPIVADLIPAS
ncbi:isochorismatase family protein [Nonomuraea terrae]|uniref:isochorismatase family protein n=1 Tax=Nonomuraea terrae TaxID=2530383 RepID=UPI0037B749DB